jgi:hypothetical protein
MACPSLMLLFYRRVVRKIRWARLFLLLFFIALIVMAGIGIKMLYDLQVTVAMSDGRIITERLTASGNVNI